MKLIAVFFFAATLSTIGSASSALAADPSSPFCQQTLPNLAQLEQLGDLKKKEADGTQYFVSGDWYRYDFEIKKSVSTIISKCVSSTSAVYYYDKKSGKEVARHTPFGGFKVN